MPQTISIGWLLIWDVDFLNDIVIWLGLVMATKAVGNYSHEDVLTHVYIILFARVAVGIVDGRDPVIELISYP